MRESILTIPINEVFEPKCGCPICRMRDMLENRTVEYIMGAAMMEPDVRIETNKLGFCGEHYSQMKMQKNRLSIALMLQTHLDELRKNEFNKSPLPEKKNLFSKKEFPDISYSKNDSTCFVCSKIDWAMERFMKTFFEMYTHDDFVKLFNEQEFICLPHYRMLISLSSNFLKKEKLTEFCSDAKKLTEKHITTLYDDVSHYCSMYDYRNTGKNADWGNSKDSIERAVKFLTTR